jgi:hypothetical protein
MQTTASYAPSEVVVIISQESSGFSHQIVGGAEGTFVKVSRDSDTWTHVTSVDNFATRVHSANDSGKITLTLMQSSPSNDILTAVYNRDKALKNSSGLFTITVKDGSGRSVDFAQEAYISNFPERDYDQTLSNREWVISCTNLQSYVGGNSLMDGADVDALNALDADVDTVWKR